MFHAKYFTLTPDSDALTSENVNVAWKEYNALQNAKENMNDSWFAWLGNLGFVGHIADRRQKFQGS